MYTLLTLKRAPPIKFAASRCFSKGSILGKYHRFNKYDPQYICDCINTVHDMCVIGNEHRFKITSTYAVPTDIISIPVHLRGFVLGRFLYKYKSTPSYYLEDRDYIEKNSKIGILLEYVFNKSRKTTSGDVKLTRLKQKIRHSRQAHKLYVASNIQCSNRVWYDSCLVMEDFMSEWSAKNIDAQNNMYRRQHMKEPPRSTGIGSGELSMQGIFNVQDLIGCLHWLHPKQNGQAMNYAEENLVATDSCGLSAKGFNLIFELIVNILACYKYSNHGYSMKIGSNINNLLVFSSRNQYQIPFVTVRGVQVGVDVKISAGTSTTLESGKYPQFYIETIFKSAKNESHDNAAENESEIFRVNISKMDLSTLLCSYVVDTSTLPLQHDYNTNTNDDRTATCTSVSTLSQYYLLSHKIPTGIQCIYQAVNEAGHRPSGNNSFVGRLAALNFIWYNLNYSHHLAGPRKASWFMNIIPITQYLVNLKNAGDGSKGRVKSDSDSGALCIPVDHTIGISTLASDNSNKLVPVTGAQQLFGVNLHHRLSYWRSSKPKLYELYASLLLQEYGFRIELVEHTKTMNDSGRGGLGTRATALPEVSLLVDYMRWYKATYGDIYMPFTYKTMSPFPAAELGHGSGHNKSSLPSGYKIGNVIRGVYRCAEWKNKTDGRPLSVETREHRRSLYEALLAEGLIYKNMEEYEEQKICIIARCIKIYIGMHSMDGGKQCNFAHEVPYKFMVPTYIPSLHAPISPSGHDVANVDHLPPVHSYPRCAGGLKLGYYINKAKYSDEVYSTGTSSNSNNTYLIGLLKRDGLWQV